MRLITIFLFAYALRGQILSGIISGNSPVAQVATPSFSPTSGSPCSGSCSITVNDTDSGLSGYAATYCTNVGSDCTPGTSYSGAVTFSANNTHMCAFANATARTQSATHCETYTVTGGITLRQVKLFNGVGSGVFTPQSNPSVLCIGSNVAAPATQNLTAVSDTTNGSWTAVDSDDAAFSSLAVYCVKNTTTSSITITFTLIGAGPMFVAEISGVNSGFPASLGNHSHGQLLVGTAADANTSGNVGGASGDGLLVFGGNYYGVTTWVVGATNPSGIAIPMICGGGSSLCQSNGGNGGGNLSLAYALLSGTYASTMSMNPGAGVTNYTNVIGLQLPH